MRKSITTIWILSVMVGAVLVHGKPPKRGIAGSKRSRAVHSDYKSFCSQYEAMLLLIRDAQKARMVTQQQQFLNNYRSALGEMRNACREQISQQMCTLAKAKESKACGGNSGSHSSYYSQTGTLVGLGGPSDMRYAPLQLDPQPKIDAQK